MGQSKHYPNLNQVLVTVTYCFCTGLEVPWVHFTISCLFHWLTQSHGLSLHVVLFKATYPANSDHLLFSTNSFLLVIIPSFTPTLYRRDHFLYSAQLILSILLTWFFQAWLYLLSLFPRCQVPASTATSRVSPSRRQSPLDVSCHRILLPDLGSASPVLLLI